MAFLTSYQANPILHEELRLYLRRRGVVGAEPREKVEVRRLEKANAKLTQQLESLQAAYDQLSGQNAVDSGQSSD